MRPQIGKLVTKLDIHPLAALLLFLAILTLGCSKKQAVNANDAEAQNTYATPSEAGQALQAAARAHDEAAMQRILGPQSKALLSSGDPVEDKAAVDSFVTKYERMNRWARMTDGSQVLYIGADNYPFPIPLAKNASAQWSFNSAAGAEEILARRIGRNELLAIDANTSIANAEEQFHRKTGHYTESFFSTPGGHDGLYWEVAEGQAKSPLGSLKDFAPNALSSSVPAKTLLLDGYSFRILTAPAETAKTVAGFTVIATPVKYQDSGIMTFLLSRDGVVYQKDLGPETVNTAASIDHHKPDEGWTAAE